jgi:hypothetical protein
LFFSRLLVWTIVFVASTSTFAAIKDPIVDPQNEFKLTFKSQRWFRSPPPPKQEKNILVLLRGPTFGKKQATMTVRRDKTAKRHSSIDHYVKAWLRNYPRFGFSIIGNRSIEHYLEKAYVIDFIGQDTKDQFRQVVYFSDKDAIIMTCKAPQESFDEIIDDCNSFVRSFQRL